MNPPPPSKKWPYLQGYAETVRLLFVQRVLVQSFSSKQLGWIKTEWTIIGLGRIAFDQNPLDKK